MAAADPELEYLQRIQSMMESFDESLSQVCKFNVSELALDLRKDIMEYYYDLYKALQSRFETLKIKEKKTEELGSKNEKTSEVTKVISCEIKNLCDKADGYGLINYIIDNMKHDNMKRDLILQRELHLALRKCPEAAKLVMKALEPPFSPNKKARIWLMESFYHIFGNGDSVVVPSDVKDSAREIAKAWRKEMKIEKNMGRRGRANIRAFLKLLVSFRIAADYERDELWELLLAVSSNAETLELCRSLGLSPNILEFIDKLSKSGQHLEALRYANEFGMLDKVDHMDLLTSYLKDVEEEAGKKAVTNAQGMAASSQAPNDMDRLQSNADIKLRAAMRDVIKLVKQYGLQSHFSEDKLRKLEQEEEGRIKNVKISRKERERNEKKAAEKNAQDEEEEDGKKADEKKAEQKEDRKKAAEKKTQEKEEQEDGKKDTDKNTQHKRCQSFEPGCGLSESENYASKRAKHASPNEKTRVAKKMAEEEDGKKAPEEKAQEKEDRKKDAEKKAQEIKEKGDRKKDAEKKAQEIKEKEDQKKDAERKAQYKRRQSFEPGYGLSEWENYASKRVKDATLNETTRVASVMDKSKAFSCNIDEVQNKYGIIGHYHNPSAFSAANTGLSAGAFASAPSIAAQINNETRHHEGYPIALRTSNLNPIGSSLYRSNVPAGDLAVPMSNVAEVNNERRGQQSYMMSFGEVDKNHVRTSVYGTGDLENSFATQSNYIFEGRGDENYKLNFAEMDNNPVRASAYVTGISVNSFAPQCHYEKRVPELYTSTFGGGNMVSIGSSVSGSNSRTFPSDVKKGSYERSPGQYSGFAGRNMVPVETSGYGAGVSIVPPSSVSQGHSQESGSVIDRYRFNSGLTSLPPPAR